MHKSKRTDNITYDSKNYGISNIYMKKTHIHDILQDILALTKLYIENYKINN